MRWSPTRSLLLGLSFSGMFLLFSPGSQAQTHPLSQASPTASPPTVSSVTPGAGPTDGGTGVIIKGADFVEGMGLWVYFGGVPSTAYSFVDTSTIQAYTPPNAAGAVDVTVVNPDRQSGTLSNGFTYTSSGALPFVSSVTPRPWTSSRGHPGGPHGIRPFRRHGGELLRHGGRRVSRSPRIPPSRR